MNKGNKMKETEQDIRIVTKTQEQVRETAGTGEKDRAGRKCRRSESGRG